MAFLCALTRRLWYPWLLGLFLLVGLVYSLGSGFFQIFGARLWLGATAGSLFRHKEVHRRGLSPAKALAAALASTIGTGSIAGVAIAITMGGPGAVFWMWLSALLGMMTSFGEKLLSVRYQQTAPDGSLQGGPMFYLRDGLGAPLLASIFAAACIPATLTGGNLIQSASIASALESSFGLSRSLVGAMTALLTGLVMMGGVHRIANISSALVPFMAVIYLSSGLIVLVCRASALPEALSLIFTCALCPKAALGGGMGYAVSSALRWGVARGVFTNEAGLGTSAMAHGAAETDHPASQGMWGIFEVCVSTLLVCTITALAILVSGLWHPCAPSSLTGVSLTTAAFASVLGPLGGGVVSLSLFLFAFSSLLGWSYYGQQALRFLTGGDRLQKPYHLVFLLCIFLGAVWDGAILWQLVDLFNALMAVPNLIGLLLLAPEALQFLSEWQQKMQFLQHKHPKKCI